MPHSNSEIFFQTLASANPWDVFLDANIIVQLIVVLLVVMGIAALIMAIVRLTSAGKARNGLLSLIAWAGPALAALGALYDGFRSYMGYTLSHATHIYVLFPTIIEAAMVLILGLFVGLVATIGNRPK